MKEVGKEKEAIHFTSDKLTPFIQVENIEEESSVPITSVSVRVGCGGLQDISEVRGHQKEFLEGNATL